MSRIERWTHNWTRQLLEAEARKRGIRDPEIRSRVELVRAILQHDYGARQSLRGARKLVSSLLDGAAQALPLLGSMRDRSERREASLPGGRPAEANRPQPPAAPPSNLQLRRDKDRIELKWQLNPQEVERARRALGYPGELALRVICVQADPAQVVRSEVTEHGPLDASGAWLMALPGPDASCVGSVGIRHAQHFISIVHTSSRVAPALADEATVAVA